MRLPVFFPCHIGLPQSPTGSAVPRRSDSTTSEREVFRGCSHLMIFRPPSLPPPRRSHRWASVADAQGGRGVYVRAQRGLLPPRASDMLAVRIRAIDGKGLSPSRFAALPAATGTFTPKLPGMSDTQLRCCARASGSPVSVGMPRTLFCCGASTTTPQWKVQPRCASSNGTSARRAGTSCER